MGILRDNLEPTDFADADCRVTDWIKFNEKESYRIFICKCTNHWFQRHEWREDGKNETRLEKWIYFGYHPRKQWQDCYRPVFI